MAFNATIATLDNVVDGVDYQLTVTTTPQKLIDLLKAAGYSDPTSIRAVSITNNDATSDVLLGYSNAMSTTRFSRKIAAGQPHQGEYGVAVMRRWWARSSTGSVLIDVVVFA